MFIFYLMSFIIVSCSSSSSSSNTLLFSAGPNSYVAFDSWRPCLNGYVRFDIRTTAHDGTLAYIDDRGKFDFFYLKLIEGKLRLLFNLGNDRQALNVNMMVNDDRWHTVMIKRDGQMTILSVDNGRTHNSTVTHSEDLYFGGSTHNEYQASPFYFGGIPAALERPSSGNLSSFDVYMQPRFRGQLRNVIYKNCTGPRLVQPAYIQVSGGVALVPSNHCSGQSCGIGLCLITDNNHKCLCDDTDRQGERCELERQPTEMTFNGKQYLIQQILNPTTSASETILFQFKTNRYDALLFVLMDNSNRRINIKLKQGQLSIEYRFESIDGNGWWESSTKDLHLIDNQWHSVQILRQNGQVTLNIDEYHLQLENEIQIDQQLNISYIYIGGENDPISRKFYGCFKDISMIIGRNQRALNLSIDFLNRSSNGPREYNDVSIRNVRCSSLLDPITFLTPSSFITFELPNSIQQTVDYQMHLRFRFQTYSSDAILLYAIGPQSKQQDFLGFDLIDGFFYVTVHVANGQRQTSQRHEPFQQRFNDGQSHYIHAHFQGYQGGMELNITMDYRQNFRATFSSSLPRLQLQKLTVGGIDPTTQSLPHNFWAGAMQRGLVGCFSDLELNHESINLTQYITNTKNGVMLKSGPCTTMIPSKRECACEHEGECRLNSGGWWSCDCSKTGYTGRRCEQAAYHLDLSMIHTFEFDTNMHWSDEINDVTFGIQAKHDKDTFMQLRPCRSMHRCDSIDFSIRNGLLYVNLRLLNQTSSITAEHPFLLDGQWHYIHLQRIDTKLLLHVDHQIAQQRLSPSLTISINSNIYSSSNIWLILNGNNQIQIEDLRLHDKSIFTLFDRQQQIKLIQRPWKPLNSISFYDHQQAHITIQLNEILCPECELDTIYFDFRTTEPNGILLFSHIQTPNTKMNYISDNNLVLKLIDGQLYLIVTIPSSFDDNDEDEIHQIQTQDRFDDGHWHHVSLYRASNYHLELRINTQEYNLLSSVHFIDTIYFGRPTIQMDDSLTLKACFASLTINNRPINLREYIKINNIQQQIIRNNCFLDSQCPLRQCQNTGICLNRTMCDCRYTSFQGRFCTDLRTGYAFDEQSSGIIFDQPAQETSFSQHKISFGLVTKMLTSEILRVSDQIQIELYRGRIRVKFGRSINDEKLDSEVLQSDIIVNDGNYHLIQFERNNTDQIRLNVDNRSLIKQILTKISFDKPLLILIGSNPAFRHNFQGQLYGLESNTNPIFDMISPTFQRISFTPNVNKVLSSILPSPNQSQDDLAHPLCSYQSYDDICTINSDSISLVFPNITILSQSLNKTGSSRNSSRRPITTTTASKIILISSSSSSSMTRLITSTEDFLNLTSNLTSNSTDIPPLIVSIRTPFATRWLSKFKWQNIWIILVPTLCGIVLCFLLALFGFMKYRRKDVGVYEVDEAQRFRPLIVELPPSPGERDHHQTISTTNPTTTTTKANKSRSRRKKKSPLSGTGEQREFYI